MMISDSGDRSRGKGTGGWRGARASDLSLRARDLT